MVAVTLVGSRLLQFSTALVMFGSPLFFLYGVDSVATRSSSAPRWPWQRGVSLIVAALALFGALAWVMAETALISNSTNDAFHPAALWIILSETPFGRACLVRIALLILSIVVSISIARSKMFWIVQSILGGAVTGSFAWTGHGAVDRGLWGAVHLAGDLLHLLTAGIWIGALLPLAVLVLRSIRSQAPTDARATQFGLDRFSALGIPIVAVLVLSGIINSWFLIGPSHWRTLLSTGYGIALLIKLGLFGLMLGLAALNRYRATPALHAALNTQGYTQSALGALQMTVLTETILAFLVLLAVSVLGTLAPPVSGMDHTSDTFDFIQRMIGARNSESELPHRKVYAHKARIAQGKPRPDATSWLLSCVGYGVFGRFQNESLEREVRLGL
jgi:copper resistance protein D